jgi:hypothetical protein
MNRDLERTTQVNVPRIASWAIVAAMLAISVLLGLDHATAIQRSPPDREEGIEVLTHEPVHEAVAETISFDPEPGVVIAKSPAKAIEELQRHRFIKSTPLHIHWARARLPFGFAHCADSLAVRGSRQARKPARFSTCDQYLRRHD